jgi:hypothetical protein
MTMTTIMTTSMIIERVSAGPGRLGRGRDG